ncbi:EAL domain-containing protein [Williamsia sp. CHRR-6]|uniref:EAL domain-containing protein n=1 Tax=Williamsia sp. CHRR-6 TaxID=2835871 RepID=UPI001BD9E561|nr:EAL domain-containing protein [Williamsia sp. CHRR-6]MBT0566255.1 EAL domain-containing protein [Williamsia sp. CHRR-6]
MAARPGTVGPVLPFASDDDFRSYAAHIPNDRLAVIVIRLESSDRVAAAYGFGTSIQVRGAALDAIAQVVIGRATVLVGPSGKGCLLVNEGEDSLQTVITDIAARLAATVTVDGVDYFVESHIGVACAGDGFTDDPRDTLQAALAGVHTAVTSGAHIAYASDLSIGDLREEIALAAELANAVGEAFTLHYQPIVALDTLAVVGYESLLRWTVDGRVRLPGEFLDAAEETSLIVPIGRWGVAEAIRQLGEWQQASDDRALFMSVNFSSQQLYDRDLPKLVARALADAGVPGSALWVEVTERDLIAADSPAAQTIAELDAIGCVICVDDLGTGYAALRYMVDQPVRVAKIDRSLITDIDIDVTKRTIVEAVCQLSSTLDIYTVAEGVEQESQIDLLRAIGFTHAQGYYFGRPQPADEVRAR